MKPLYVLVDNEGNFAEKRSGKTGTPVFTSPEMAKGNKRHYSSHTSSKPFELNIVKFEGVDTK